MTTIKAVLGPTNTGKTHYAVERMLAHTSGMIGLPLRLLAREVYDKVVAQKGASAVALVTGEERIWPDRARYFVCTVEAMPVHIDVDCMVIDEIQLASDPDRGHVFTDRLLRARGRSETLFLGSETMQPILNQLDLCGQSDRRERFSQLTYMGAYRVTKLPKRSAIVAFSADEVYAIAELLKRKKGGAAVVMGALSPRTRNAQVDLYQQGDVDYLVATDAIGMGLNLDVDHIAFASAIKFDGRRRRRLTPAEMGQIAGRAGRFRSEGTFGETGDCPQFEEELVNRIENHTFQPVERLEWRNSDLDYASLNGLMASLARPSGTILLKQNPEALDEWTLRRMAVETDVVADVKGAHRVRRLWDLCRLPDFRKAGLEGHFRLVQSLYEHLAGPDDRLSDRAMENRLERLSSSVGDIPTLQTRLAAIRTWTYASNRDDWLENPDIWREKTRELEDKLSDALHEALTARFVDKRTTALLAGLDGKKTLTGNVDADGEITVEGHSVGRLHGLVFTPASTAKTLEGKAVRDAALSTLRPILMERITALIGANETSFKLSETGEIVHGGAPVARLVSGSDWLSPRIEIVGAKEIEQAAKQPLQERLEAWLTDYVRRILPTHSKLKSGEANDALTGYARGLAFRLQESGAAIDLRDDDPGQRLEATDREALKALGLRAGRVAAHVPDAQKPAAQRLISTLKTLAESEPCLAAPEGAGSFPLDGSWSDAALNANGYIRFGPRAVRADLAERLAWDISKRRREANAPKFEIPPEVASIVSCPGAEFPALLKGLGVVPAERTEVKDEETGEVTSQVTSWRYLSRSRSQPDQGSDGRQRNRIGRPGQRNGNSDAQNRQGGRKSPDKQGRKGKPRPQGGDRRGRSVKPEDSPFAALAALMPSEPAKPKKKPKKKKAKPSQESAKPVEVSAAPSEAVEQIETPTADATDTAQEMSKTSS